MENPNCPGCGHQLVNFQSETQSWWCNSELKEVKLEGKDILDMQIDVKDVKLSTEVLAFSKHAEKNFQKYMHAFYKTVGPAPETHSRKTHPSQRLIELQEPSKIGLIFDGSIPDVEDIDEDSPKRKSYGSEDLLLVQATGNRVAPRQAAKDGADALRLILSLEWDGRLSVEMEGKMTQFDCCPECLGVKPTERTRLLVGHPDLVKYQLGHENNCELARLAGVLPPDTKTDRY